MPANSIILVIGSGRSGTSLLTKLLHEFGMSLSDDLIGPSAQNPQGAFEDKFIFQAHEQIFKKNGLTPKFPIPNKFLSLDGVEEIHKKLISHTRACIANSNTIWGFKDPKTASLLPIWTKLCNQEKLVPIYVLAVRHPSSVSRSMAAQYNDPQEVADVFWLSKNINAILHTGGNLFVVHYEDWFTEQADQIANELLEYTELSMHFKGDIKQVLSNNIQSNLNRSKWGQGQIKNAYVNKLYDALKECRGSNFNHDALMEVVLECKRGMDQFIGWVVAAQSIITNKAKQISRLQNRVDQGNTETKELKAIAVDFKTLTEKNIEVGTQVKELEQECSKLVELNNHMSKQKVKSDENISDLKSTISYLESIQTQLQLKKKTLTKDNIEVSTQVKELEQECSKLVELNNHMSKQKVKSDENISDLKSTISYLESIQTQLQSNEKKKDKRLRKIEAKNETLKAQVTRLEKILGKRERRIIALETSSSFLFGKAFIEAVFRPGKNTILFPYRIIKSFVNALGTRKK